MRHYATLHGLLDPNAELRGQHGRYIPDPDLVHAANTAIVLGRPLLLAGEPGSGKSDFAWVLANALGLPPPLRCQVRSDSQARDLLYHYDALVRFRDAQFGEQQRASDPRHYVRLRPLGVAMVSEKQHVVLIDEVDKAPRDLPNDLLMELEEHYFEIPELRGTTVGERQTSPSHEVTDPAHPTIPLRAEMRAASQEKRPLLVITSNAERQLPEPFLRRCVFFHIPPFGLERLLEIVRVRFPDEDPSLLRKLATIFVTLRSHAKLTKPPGTSEMLDWTKVMADGYERSYVEAIVDAFMAAIVVEGEKPPRLKADAQPWRTLPGLESLLKLSEDREKLRV